MSLLRNNNSTIMDKSIHTSFKTATNSNTLKIYIPFFIFEF